MMNKRGGYLRLLLAASLSLPLLAHGENAAALKERLHQANLHSSLDQPEMKPWHLSLSVQLMDTKGLPDQTGTVEEWWASPKLHKIVYTSGANIWTEIENEDGLYRSARATQPPELVAAIRTQIVHPVPDDSEINDSLPRFEKKQLGKVTLDCVMLAQPIKGMSTIPFGLFPTYCLDHDAVALRLSYNYGSQLITRNTMSTFAGKSVAVDQSIDNGNVLAAKAHLTALRAEPLTAADFVQTADMIKVDDKPYSVDDKIMAGRCLKKTNPIYPESAKRAHISGSVILHAIIGTDGRIHSLRPVSSPDADLTIASIAAVRQWIYDPYLRNGEPTMVDTTITVNFSFGPMPGSR